MLRIAQKIIRNGPAWALKRARSELRNPSFRAMKRFLYVLHTIKQRTMPNPRGGEAGNHKRQLVAVYDLNSNPITFDFAWFLVGAEMFARRNGMDSFVVWFVQKRSESTYGTYSSVVDGDSQKWRFDNIVLPLSHLCPACVGHYVLPRSTDICDLIRGEFVYPEHYDGQYIPGIDYREIYQSAKRFKFTGLQASLQGLRYIESWKNAYNIKKDIVTITLRQYGYDVCRNSNIAEWVQFARSIMAEGFVPVFVPDTDASFNQDNLLKDFIVFKEPCWNMGLRVALYEKSLLNLFCSSGPGALAQLNANACYICMKVISPSSFNASENVFRDRGIKIGQRQYFDNFSDAYQVLSWADDTFENIRAEFDSFLRLRR